ncbi:GntR family transcriptional regulator [Desulfocurvus sp. DL9XJH121]
MEEQTTSLAEKARSMLERMIVFEELNSQDMYSEKQLASMLDMGRTPVREALQRLAHDKMVVVHPRRGVQFPPVTAESQLKLLEVRRGLEPLCVRYAALRGDVAQKRRMLQLADEILKAAEANDAQGTLEAMREIHDLLAEATNNEYFQRVMGSVQGLSRRFWIVNLRNGGSLADGATHHATIMRAVAKGEVIKAEAASEDLLDYLSEYSYDALKMETDAKP